MADDAPDLAVTPAIARRAVEIVRRALPTGVRLMPIGGTLMARLGPRPGSVTKDVDLVLFVLEDGSPAIPDLEFLTELAERIGRAGSVRFPNDRTNVSFLLDLPEGPVRVEIIRGRGAKGGYFIRRTVLEGLARYARERDGILDLPPEGLVFLKAWAAVDKDRIVRADKDARGYHASRAAVFRRDVAELLTATLAEARPPDGSLMKTFLDLCEGPRRKEIEAVLRRAGWPVE